MSFRKFLSYLTFLVPWFLAVVVFPIDTNYYSNLTLPWFAPKPIVFGIVWPILYLLIAYSIFKVFSKCTSNYKIYLVINYLSNQLFTWCFFGLQNLFLAFVDTLIVFISSLYLYVETKILNQNYTWYFIPYIVWNFFALILILTIFFLNL